jgi:hypothetical protein
MALLSNTLTLFSILDWYITVLIVAPALALCLGRGISHVMLDIVDV